MKAYHTETLIAASAEQVWRILTAELPKDPIPFGILRLEGAVALGARIKLWSEVVPNRAFSLKVKEFTPPGRMVWVGGMPFGLFAGTRSFEIKSAEGGSVFLMSEVFEGRMSGMITKSMPDLTLSFEKFAKTLKEKAEET